MRIIRLQNDVEALTLSNNFIETGEFMLQMMRDIIPDWLNGELKCEKAKQEEVIKCSVILNEKNTK